MGMFDEVLAFIDARKRAGKRNIQDFVQNPGPYLEMTADQAAKELADPRNYMAPMGGGYGAGIVQLRNMKGQPIPYPTASIVGQMRSLGLLDDNAARMALREFNNDEFFDMLGREALDKKRLMGQLP